jgi:hypothetical protein
MSYIDDLSKGIDKAYAEKDYEVVEILTERLRQEVGKGGGGGAGFLKNVATGLASGAIGMYESAALGGAALLEEEEELKAREKIQSVASSFRPDGGDKDSLTYKLSSGLGSIGALLPTALLGPAALPAAAAIAGGAGAGEASERARDFGATEEERSSATFRGSLIGLTEIAPLGRIAKGLQIPGVAEVLKKVDANDLKGIKNRIRSVATTGVAEGAQEAAAAILQNLNARGYDAEAELIDAGVLDEATIGGGAGAIIQALADVIAGRRGGKSVGTDGAIAGDDKSDEQAVEEVFGLPSLPETVNIPMPDGSLRENVPIDDPQAQVYLRSQELQGDAETRRGTERAAILEVQDREQGLASLVKDDAAEQARRQTGDLFPLEKEAAEREAARAPKGISDAEMADAMAEKDAETERAERLEDDDQIKPDGDMVDRARYEELQDKQIDERTAAEDIELAEMQRQEDAAKEADDLEVERMVIADEDKTAQSELEAQIKERKPKETQQPATEKSKTDAKKRGVRRSAVETGDVDSAAKTNIPEKRVAVQDEQVAQIGPSDAEKTAIASNLTAIIKKNKAEPSNEIMAGRLEKSIVKDKRRSAVETGDVTKPVDTSPQAEPPADIEGSIEFPTAVPRGTEFTNPDDVTAINTLLDKKIPRDEKGMEQTAQTYLKRFKRPADAFTAIAFEIAENTLKFRAQKGTPTSEKAKFAGTGGTNTKATLQWIEQNLSPDAKAEIDKRVVEQQKESTKVEKDVTARSTSAAEATRLKRRDNEAAVKVDKATDGKAKVVGTSTPRKKVFKVEDAVPEATDIDANPKTGTKPTKMTDNEKKLAATSEAIENVQDKKGKNAKAPLSEDMSPDQLRDRLASDTAKYIAGGGKIDVLNLELDPKVAIELDANLPTDVKALIKKGDLKGALQSLSKSSKNKRIKQIARALSENTGTTKIELANEASLKDKGYDIGDKSDVAGMFDPRINTILLNSNLPLTVHALLHEATHASTINQLKNKSHPATKQLNKLYQDVKPYLDSVYGAENLNEFIAEAFSNPVFQRKLASINPKGEEISALQRLFRTVTNYVRRLIGMDTKPMGSALDEADAAIIAMLSPNSRTRDSAVMNMMSSPANVKKVLNDMASVQKSLIAGPKKAFIDGAVEFLGDAGINGKAKEVLLKLTGSQALGDIARGVGFGQIGIKLHTAYETMRGNIQTADEKIKESLDGYDAWAKDAGRDQVELLDNIVYSEEYGATVYQVDPTKPQSDYKGKTDDSGNDLEAVWVAQSKQWKKLNSAGKDMFNSQRAEYKRLHKELVKVINNEIDALEANIDPSDKEAVKAFKDKQFSLKKQINQKLLEAGELEVYFPLVRQGKYKLSFDTTIKNDDGTTRVEPVFLMFDRKVDRDNMLAEVEADTNTVGDPDAYDGDTKRSSFNNAPSGSFVSDVLAIVNASMPKGKGNTETQEQIMRLFIESLPETSFAKSLQKRKGVMGYDKNVRGAMNNKGYSLSSQIEKMKSSALIRTLEKEVRDTKRPKDVNLDTFNRVKDELFVRSQFARTGATNKTTERLAQRSNQLAFIYTIGFNASSALVNLSQIPLVVGPFLSGKFGMTETSTAMAKASKFVGASKLSIDEYYDIKDGEYTLKPSMEKKLRDANTKKTDADAAVAEYKRMIPMVKAAKGRGQVYHSELKDQLRAGQGTSKNPALKLLDMVSSASAVMFSTAERFNRQTTLTMSYNLVLDKLEALDTSNKKGKRERYYSALDAKFIDVPTSSEARMDFAAKEALYLTQEVNGGSVLETAAGYSQQGLGRVALMYKSYGLQMYYSMLKAGKMYIDNRGGTDAESVQLRKMARNQLLGIHGSALFFAGAQGVPLYGAVAMIADLFFLDDEEDDFDTAVRKHIGEGWYKGAVTELTGVDIAGRVRLTGLLLQENRFNKDASLEENLAFYLGGPALSTANRLYRGVSDLRSGDIGSVERGIESLAPAGLTNAWRSSVGRYAREGGIRTRRGDPIYDDMTAGDFAAQALGFPPAEYTFIQERTARNKGVEKAITTKRTRLTKQFYIANRMGDHETMGEVLKDIVAHNRRHPTAAINSEQIMKSVKSHMATSAKMHNGVTINPLMKYAIMKSNMEYNQ